MTLQCRNKCSQAAAVEPWRAELPLMLSRGAAVRGVKRTNLPGSNGGAADAEKVAAMSPDIVTFNGRAFQYPPPSIWGRGKGCASGFLTLARKGAHGILRCLEMVNRYSLLEPDARQVSG